MGAIESKPDKQGSNQRGAETIHELGSIVDHNHSRGGGEPLPDDEHQQQHRHGHRNSHKQEGAAGEPYSHRLQELRGDLKSQGPINMNVATTQQAIHTAEEARGQESLEARVLQVIHHKTTQVILACLLVLDIIILFTELALLTLYPACHLVRRDGISCCPVADEKHYNDYLMRNLGGSDSDYCEQEGTVPLKDYEAGCDDHKWHTVHRAEDFLYGMTMTILFIFWVELILLIWALKPNVFFRQFFFVLDFTIVTVSIALELLFKFMDDDTLTSMVGLLILARVWRFVRIGHGIVEVTADAAREKYEVLVDYTEELELLLRQNKIALPEDQTSRDAQKVCRSLKGANASSQTDLNLVEEVMEDDPDVIVDVDKEAAPAVGQDDYDKDETKRMSFEETSRDSD